MGGGGGRTRALSSARKRGLCERNVLPRMARLGRMMLPAGVGGGRAGAPCRACARGGAHAGAALARRDAQARAVAGWLQRCEGLAEPRAKPQRTRRALVKGRGTKGGRTAQSGTQVTASPQAESFTVLLIQLYDTRHRTRREGP